MRFELPKIYPITDRRLSGLSHTEQVERLIDGGATLIQLREKELSPAEFYDDARTAVDLAQAHGVRIVINDRVDIALAVGADGVHVGQDDLPPDQVRKLLGVDAIVGFSTHSRAQIEDARRLNLSYLAIGPIFSTRTKNDPDPVVGLDDLKAIRKLAGDVPLVAIGGIDLDNASEVLAAGADSIAVISALHDGHDPATALRKFNTVITL